jgi:hypothetical protein
MLSQHFVWMAPVGSLLLFAIPTLGLALLNRKWPTRVPLHVAAGIFASMAALGLIFMYPRIHRAAMLILACGVGIQVVRMVASRPDGFRKVVHGTVAWMAALVVLMGVAVGGSLWWRERRAIASLPEAREGAPNVLLIILDTVRAMSLSLYGYERPTSPALDEFAQRGVVFDNAISAAPWTLPAHATMFTGQYPHLLSADWRDPLDRTYPTLAEVLSAHGYVTAGFVSNTYYASYEHGLARGFAHYDDYATGLGQVLNSSSLGFMVFAGRAGFSVNFLRTLLQNYEYLGRKKADRISHDFLTWLDDRPDRPFSPF